MKIIFTEEYFMNRKIGFVFMCIALAAVMLTGCGSSSGGDKTINISFWKSPHSNREEEIWNSIIALFNKDFPNIKVEFLVVPWDQVNQKEMAAFSAGTPPDVSFQVEQYLAYATVNKLVDLKEYVSAEKLAGYPKGALDYCTYQNKLVGVPFVALNTVMFYNKDIFAAAGIQKTPATWDELVKAAQACTKDTNGDGKIDQYGLLLNTKPRLDIWTGVNFIQQAGGDLWNKEMTSIGFNNQAGITGLQFYTDLFNRYKVAPPIDEFSSAEEEQNAFYTGKIAMWPAQIHTVGNIRSANPQLNVGAFLLPSGPAADKVYANWAFANIGMLSIASDSSNKDASWKFVEFATRPDIESQYLSQVGFFSPQMATNDLMYQDDEIMKIAAPGIAIMQTSPASRNFEAMFANFPVMLEKCVRGVATPAQAIQELENDLKELNG
jgi:multiple sugar transport system substrate-binding protein